MALLSWHPGSDGHAYPTTTTCLVCPPLVLQSFILSLEAQLQQYKDSGIRPAKAAPVGNTGLASSEEQVGSLCLSLPLACSHRVHD